MSEFNPDKLTVEFMKGVTEISPLIPRRYTLTHSDITGELFLDIGRDFDYGKITSNRDEVLGEWIWLEEGIQYHVYLYVDGELAQGRAVIREAIFRKELPLALEAIRYGDGNFFDRWTEFDNYPIIVYFLYSNSEQNKAENRGTFSDYVVRS
jgi:hypothetical protein